MRMGWKLKLLELITRMCFLLVWKLNFAVKSNKDIDWKEMDDIKLIVLN